MIPTILLNAFQQIRMSPNKLGYIMFAILSYSLFLDWVKIRNEFRNSLYAEATMCEHLYKLNRCNTPIPAMVKQCIEWYTCTRTQNVPGTLIWAEVVKRFLNGLLALDSHAMILITINVFIVVLLLVDREFFRYFLDVSKDIIRFLLMCATVVGGIWLYRS
jgi:Di-sulfide bridge nucleocytoplasmic transport domain